VIEDIRAPLARTGITKLVLINGHGGNYVLSNITQQANVQHRQVLLYPGREDWNAARTAAGMTTNSHDDMHGGELEASLLLHTHPNPVRDTYTTADHHAPDRPHLLTNGMSAYTTTGIIGSPSQATATKGKAALDTLITSSTQYLEILPS
jgi:creatinine amidohydrolase